MSWELYIDDERFPDKPIIIARTSREAILMVGYWGCPSCIHFDYDLADKNVEEFIDWFEGQLEQGNFTLPVDFTYAIHSSNKEGRVRIKERMTEITMLY